MSKKNVYYIQKLVQECQCQKLLNITMKGFSHLVLYQLCFSNNELEPSFFRVWSETTWDFGQTMSVGVSLLT